MSEETQPRKTFKFVHGGALTLLLLMMVQPSIDNVSSLLSGTWSIGESSVEVTFGNTVGHVVAMVLGWVALWLFFQRRKLGAYLTVVAHGMGFGAAIIGMPELLFSVMTPTAIVIFFLITVGIALGPIFAFKDQYT